MSGRHDLNMRPLRPERSALARLSYAPKVEAAYFTPLRQPVNRSYHWRNRLTQSQGAAIADLGRFLRAAHFSRAHDTLSGPSLLLSDYQVVWSTHLLACGFARLFGRRPPRRSASASIAVLA